MRYVAEFRDSGKCRHLADEIARLVRGRWVIMEVCGGQTHAIIRYGIDQLLPEGIELLHGPGCPVCVTPVEVIDQSIAIARRPQVILCTFGDMLRVPGSHSDLYRVKGEGADVRVIYSPLDALKIAREHPKHEVVMLAIGFETTAPANAMALKLAKQSGLKNFSALVSHVLVPPALDAILKSPSCRVNGFLAAGHVCCITGIAPYSHLCHVYGIPVVVTGFEPVDILEGIRRTVVQLETGRSYVDNAYSRVVSEVGNLPAQAVLQEVFETTDRVWRGIGLIPESGWRLSPAYHLFDAEQRFDLPAVSGADCHSCRSGEVLTGAIKPHECAAFGTECTPLHPLGATMVSGEGACAAYYHYGRVVARDDLKSP